MSANKFIHKLLFNTEEKKLSENKVQSKEKVVLLSADEKKKLATPKRIIACVLWLVALIAEVIAILFLFGKIVPPGNVLYWLIGAIALDLILVIAAAQLWKKANHIDPASEKNKFKFFMWNNFGVLMAIVCFLPLLILILTNKNLKGSDKTILAIVTVVALLAGGLLSVDWNPVSQEQQAAAEQQILASGSDVVLVTTFGHRYHASVPDWENHKDQLCYTIRHSENISQEIISLTTKTPCLICMVPKSAGGEAPEVAPLAPAA